MLIWCVLLVISVMGVVLVIGGNFLFGYVVYCYCNCLCYVFFIVFF